MATFEQQRLDTERGNHGYFVNTIVHQDGLKRKTIARLGKVEPQAPSQCFPVL